MDVIKEVVNRIGIVSGASEHKIKSRNELGEVCRRGVHKEDGL